MELSNSEILFISHILVKLLKQDIELKNKVDELCKTSVFAEPQILDNQFKEFSVEKRKRGRPFGSLKKCISSER
jgi:hypothetical protein